RRGLPHPDPVGRHRQGRPGPGEWGMGNGEWGMKDKQTGTGTGSGSRLALPTPDGSSIPHSPFPIPHWRLFQHLRWQLLRNSWHPLLGQPLRPGGERPAAGNWTRPLTILLCSVVVWVFVFAISWGGFWFLKNEVRLPADGAIVGLLLDLLFVALGVLLI